MIIVTGTKRSGTSMWMRLLRAAGFPPIGDAFPRDWETTLRDANPGGFWESELRRGVYYRTNPDSGTGTYLFPAQTATHAVKVFIPGLIKTDRAFIDKVIATVRPWREYVRSVNRLYAIERDARQAALKGEDNALAPAVFMNPVIEWWVENFSLISDIVTRRYPFYMVAYDSVLDSPEQTLRNVFDWLGDGDVESALCEVEPALRTQSEVADQEAEVTGVDLEAAVFEVFDALYERVLGQGALDQAFIDRLNQTNEQLRQPIETAAKDLTKRRLERRRLIQRLRDGDGDRGGTADDRGQR